MPPDEKDKSHLRLVDGSMTYSENCGTCRYLHQDERLTCRRFPPVVTPTSAPSGIFPGVQASWSCGEWKGVTSP